MAWNNDKRWATGDLVQASDMQTFITDNFEETGPAKVENKGDILYATAANTLAALARPTVDGQYLRYNNTTQFPYWAGGPAYHTVHQESLDGGGFGPVDFNDADLRVAGNYQINGRTRASGGNTNAPNFGDGNADTGEGFLIVAQTDDSAFIQIYFPRNRNVGQFAIRKYDVNQWWAWQYYSPLANIGLSNLATSLQNLINQPITFWNSDVVNVGISSLTDYISRPSGDTTSNLGEKSEIWLFSRTGGELFGPIIGQAINGNWQGTTSKREIVIPNKFKVNWDTTNNRLVFERINTSTPFNDTLYVYYRD